MFVNSGTNSAIKKLVLSCSEDGKEYHEWTQIEDIKKVMNERQWFNVNESEILSCLGSLTFIRMEIKDDHGNGYHNSFYEFVVRKVYYWTRTIKDNHGNDGIVSVIMPDALEDLSAVPESTARRQGQRLKLSVGLWVGSQN